VFAGRLNHRKASVSRNGFLAGFLAALKRSGTKQTPWISPNDTGGLAIQFPIQWGSTLSWEDKQDEHPYRQPCEHRGFLACRPPLSPAAARELTPQTILTPILLLHGLRHLGLMFLAGGAVYAGMPEQFAYPAAYGDLLAAALAIASLLALTRNLRISRLLVWIFSIEGTVDLINAITLATIYDAADFMGPAYWIPAFWVPALIVTPSHFLVLLKH